MSEAHNCPCTPECPLQKAFRLIGGRWKMSILCSLTADGPMRYNDLKRRMDGISNTMLVKSLKELEEGGLVARNEYLEVPVRVEYAVTDQVRSLLPILGELAQWAAGLPAPGPGTEPDAPQDADQDTAGE